MPNKIEGTVPCSKGCPRLREIRHIEITAFKNVAVVGIKIPFKQPIRIYNTAIAKAQEHHFRPPQQGPALCIYDDGVPGACRVKRIYPQRSR